MQANGVVYEEPSNGLENAKATLRDYISIMKWGITIANLMATFAGMWVASGGHPGLAPLLLTLVGTALVVAGGAALNNFYDRDIDQHMARTKHRAVAQGKVSPAAALAIGLSMSVVGLAVLLLFVNWQSAACAFVGLFVYSYLYTVWFKRHTTLNTVLGGVSGAMPPLIGWAAGSGGSISLAGWCLFFTFFLWQPPHFLPLAMKKTEDYRAAGIPMLPVVRGFRETKRQIVLYTAAMVPVSLMMTPLGAEGWIYFVVMAVLGIWFLYLGVKGLYIQPERDLEWANQVFRFSLIYLTALCVVCVLSVSIF
ncbi:protoheme IX farnesyltransferase 2 [Alicyclobacillus hesperidum]|uniref:Protoheme IX farnesyltransferase n=1 Tax=Alicyclobacillus hesperidum TaxID=89784 RepID=A0A1H2RV08_9BACL|nr:heme o synthase [Alicyclobacillus hesperidum]KRW92604.1 protoheme IX farnesyltransferase [Alicyclobacillus tengchongensis]GLV13457.1 protoheme IX farnesyltransferase 2 [Alicyclobacillus hesperidum]SDW23125.1 protoheme IX farnesyltransferase [Alicyclobacillus hesperidum]